MLRVNGPLRRLGHVISTRQLPSLALSSASQQFTLSASYGTRNLFRTIRRLQRQLVNRTSSSIHPRVFLVIISLSRARVLPFRHRRLIKFRRRSLTKSRPTKGNSTSFRRDHQRRPILLFNRSVRFHTRRLSITNVYPSSRKVFHVIRRLRPNFTISLRATLAPHGRHQVTGHHSNIRPCQNTILRHRTSTLSIQRKSQRRPLTLP